MNAVDFIVPTTSRNTDFEFAEDTHLYRIFFKSLAKHRSSLIGHIFVGYDKDDKIFSQKTERDKFQKFGMLIHWIPVEPDAGNVVKIWNYLATLVKNDYLMVIGDDILFPNDKNWLGLFVKMLKKNNNWGWSAGYSNNDKIATQFLIHRKHIDYFGWVYPPQLTNWYCDDFMFGVYPQHLRNWRKDYPLLNCGGNPRYYPCNDKNICEKLIQRHKKTLLKNINNFKYMD